MKQPDHSLLSFVHLASRQVTTCFARSDTNQGSAEAQPTVIALNGTGSDLRNAPNPLAWPIAPHFDIVALDHRGLGQSVSDDPAYQPTMADFADDIIALADVLGIGQFAVVGISFGGMVAQELAIRSPGRLTKLVLCCTSAGGTSGASYPLHDLYSHGQSMDDIFDLWDTRSAHDPKVAALMHRILDGPEGPSEPPLGLLQQVEARRHHDAGERLGSLTMPTLVAHGRFDGVAPAKNSETLANLIPNSKLASFDGGHMFLWQDRTAWPTIDAFLRDSNRG